MDIQDMKIAQVEYYEHWGDENSPDSDWHKLSQQGAATFQHKTACEFIVALGNDPEEMYLIQQLAEQWKMSEVFLSYCRHAKELGYNYVCFYS